MSRWLLLLAGFIAAAAMAAPPAQEPDAKDVIKKLIEALKDPDPDVRQNLGSALAKIGNYHGPLLQTHGDQDELIPLELGQKLFAAANQPKQFVLVRGGGHNTLPSAEYFQALYRFLERLSRSPSDV